MLERIRHYIAEKRGIKSIASMPSEAGRTLALWSVKAKRSAYREFHDELAAKVGRKIEWAE